MRRHKQVFFFFYIKVVTKGMVSRGSGGSIVNISSVAGFRAVPNHTIYCTAKAALDMLSMTLALELGPHKVILTFFSPLLLPSELNSLPSKYDELVSL